MTLPFRTRITDPVAEGISPRLTAVVQDETGAALAADTLDAMTLSLYDLDSPTSYVNGRDHVPVLNGNGGLLDQQGNFIWQGEPDDTALGAGAGDATLRVALLEWTWSGGSRVGRHEVLFEIRNLGHVPVTP